MEEDEECDIDHTRIDDVMIVVHKVVTRRTVVLEKTIQTCATMLSQRQN